MYIGVTNDLRRRLYEHKKEQIEGFTKKYHVHKLVYFEEFPDVNYAIAREKQLKGWTRAKKNSLVESKNPNWIDWGEIIFKNNQNTVVLRTYYDFHLPEMYGKTEYLRRRCGSLRARTQL